MGGTCGTQADEDIPPHALHQQYLDTHHYYRNGADSSPTDSKCNTIQNLLLFLEGDTINTPKYQIINIDPFGLSFEQPNPVETRKKIEEYVSRNKPIKAKREKSPSKLKRNNDVFIPSEFRKSLLQRRKERASSRSLTPVRQISINRGRSTTPVTRRESRPEPPRRNDPKRREVHKPTPLRIEPQSKTSPPRRLSLSEPRQIRQPQRSYTPRPRIAPQAFHPNPSKNTTHLIVYPEYSRSPMPWRNSEDDDSKSLMKQRERSVTPMDPLRVHSVPNMSSSSNPVERLKQENDMNHVSPPRGSVSFLLPVSDVPEFSRSRSARRSRRSGVNARTQRQYSMLGLQAVESQRAACKRIVPVEVHKRPSNPNLVGKRELYNRSPSYGGKRLPDSRSPHVSRARTKLHKHDPTLNADLGPNYRESAI